MHRPPSLPLPPSSSSSLPVPSLPPSPHARLDIPATALRKHGIPNNDRLQLAVRSSTPLDRHDTMRGAYGDSERRPRMEADEGGDARVSLLAHEIGIGGITHTGAAPHGWDDRRSRSVWPTKARLQGSAPRYAWVAFDSSSAPRRLRSSRVHTLDSFPRAAIARLVRPAPAPLRVRPRHPQDVTLHGTFPSSPALRPLCIRTLDSHCPLPRAAPCIPRRILDVATHLGIDSRPARRLACRAPRLPVALCPRGYIHREFSSPAPARAGCLLPSCLLVAGRASSSLGLARDGTGKLGARDSEPRDRLGHSSMTGLLVSAIHKVTIYHLRPSSAAYPSRSLRCAWVEEAETGRPICAGYRFLLFTVNTLLYWENCSKGHIQLITRQGDICSIFLPDHS
ncbi:hypothetical protein DFH06DRAFT_1446420 [Mycena polygramma]|nr:hypothetical protein DFH06DRAFT_1446420 [Mycena polygramma]